MDPLATYLYARPSFLEGSARAFDIGGKLNEYNRSVDGRQADFIALWLDWHLVGTDFKAAAQGVEGEAAADQVTK